MEPSTWILFLGSLCTLLALRSMLMVPFAQTWAVLPAGYFGTLMVSFFVRLGRLTQVDIE
ncbi:hypothetical protein LINPERHAP1_LOCUS11676, partial [Linum perenne]